MRRLSIGLLLFLSTGLGLGGCGAQSVAQSGLESDSGIATAEAGTVATGSQEAAAAVLDLAGLDEREAAAVAQARVVLAAHLQLPEPEMQAADLLEVSAQQWRNSSLGCAKPGEYAAQVMTDGYRVVLRYASKRYPVHTGRRGGRLCEKIPAAR